MSVMKFGSAEACEDFGVEIEDVVEKDLGIGAAVAQMVTSDGYGLVPDAEGTLHIPFHPLHELTVRSRPLALETGDFATFKDQYCITASSAVLIADNLMLTAGHAIHPGAIATTYFIFGRTSAAEFGVEQDRLAVPKQRYARGVRLRECWSASDELDFALIEIDAMPRGARPISGLGCPQVGTDCVVIGHPLGLPMKIACSKIDGLLGDGPSTLFSVGTDSGGGASGSAILQGGRVVGVMRGNAKVPPRAYVTRVDRHGNERIHVDLSQQECADGQTFTSSAGFAGHVNPPQGVP